MALDQEQKSELFNGIAAMADELPDGDTLRILVLTDSHVRVLEVIRCYEALESSRILLFWLL